MIFKTKPYSNPPPFPPFFVWIGIFIGGYYVPKRYAILPRRISLSRGDGGYTNRYKQIWEQRQGEYNWVSFGGCEEWIKGEILEEVAGMLNLKVWQRIIQKKKFSRGGRFFQVSELVGAQASWKKEVFGEIIRKQVLLELKGWRKGTAEDIQEVGRVWGGTAVPCLKP